LVVLEAAVLLVLLQVVPHILVKVIMEVRTAEAEALQVAAVQVASVKLYITMVVMAVLVLLTQ
jgi:hypothetical protein